MTGFLMIVVWVIMSTGQPKMETKLFATESVCQTEASSRAQSIYTDGDALIAAGCLSGVPMSKA